MRIHDYDLDPDDAVGDDLAVDDDDHPDFFWAMNFFDFQIHVYYFLSWMVALDLYVLQELASGLLMASWPCFRCFSFVASEKFQSKTCLKIQYDQDCR